MTAIALAQTAGPSSEGAPRARSDEQSIQRLIGACMAELYRYAYWLCGNSAVADDLVQETLVRAWKSMDRLNDPKAVQGMAADYPAARECPSLRTPAATGKRNQPVEDLAARRQDYDTSTEAFVLRQALDACRRVPRAAVAAGDQRLSQKEIAQHLGISVAGAGTRLFRAREKMRALL